MPKNPSGLWDCTKFWVEITGLKNPMADLVRMTACFLLVAIINRWPYENTELFNSVVIRLDFSGLAVVLDRLRKIYRESVNGKLIEKYLALIKL